MRFFLFLLLFSQHAFSFQDSTELKRLFDKFDRDQDKKITADDKISAKEVFETSNVKAKGLYQISIVAQELALQGKIAPSKLKENPVERISRTIRELYWDGLTRQIDSSTILKVASDPKIESKELYLYIPRNDQEAFKHYKNSKINVVKLPENIPENFITKLGKKQGLLSLAMKDGKGIPYVVPGGRFNEMYGWDSYFHVLGTLTDGRTDLAKGMVDNFVYEINHYGKILNANRTYYLTRSQPPFLTSMIKAVYEVLPKNRETQEWLDHCLKAAIKEYETVWMGKDRLTEIGLSRYAGFDGGIPPEVEPGHFDHILIPFAKKHRLTLQELKLKFNQGKLQDPELTEFFHQDRAVRESGHDTTYRWRVGENDRASDFVTVDLNSLLYKYEIDLSELIQDKEVSKKYQLAALKRKELIRKFLWNDKKKLFFDYNFKTKSQSLYISATTFYPLWAGDILTKEEATDLLKAGLKELESNGGLSATAKSSLNNVIGKKEERQWDFPNGWAPHQMLAWQGFENYGFEKEKNRLIYKWLFMITKNAMDYNGTIPEKYDVVSRSHKVFAEYGNVGTKFSYITKEGFGWMNASYQLGLKKLSSEQKKQLFELKDPIHE